MDVHDVNRALRSTIWPSLEARGFTVRTDRVAWRYGPRAIDLVEITSIGALADSVGCTSFSFGAYVASMPPYLAQAQVPVGKDKRPRPHYWHCRLKKTLSKSLSQPWFRPFGTQVNPRTSLAILKHREGLMEVIRRDAHDRSDTWFVLDDGSNLDEDLADVLAALERDGLPLLDRFHDPCSVIEILREGKLEHTNPGSPAGRQLTATLELECTKGRTGVE